MQYGPAIKTIRTHLGMTQETLSKKMGITQTSLSQIESGAKRPHESTLKKVCKSFKIPPVLLLYLSFEKNDVDPKKRLLYDQLFPVIKDMILLLVQEENKDLASLKLISGKLKIKKP